MSDGKSTSQASVTTFAEMSQEETHALFDVLSNPAMHGEMGDRVMGNPVETVGFLAEVTDDCFLRAALPEVSSLAKAGEAVSLARVRGIVCEIYDVPEGFQDWAALVASRKRDAEFV